MLSMVALVVLALVAPWFLLVLYGLVRWFVSR